MTRLRGIAVAGAVVAVVGTVPAHAGGHRPYVQSREYLFPHGVRTSHHDEPLRDLPQLDGVTFTPRPTDRFVRFEYADATGMVVWAQIHQDGRRGGPDLDAENCGFRGTFELVSSKPIEIRMYDGLCENHLFSVATRGTITATFTQDHPGGLTRSHPH